MKIQTLNKWTGILLILLSLGVAIPLTIKTVQTDGGPWGFGVVGLSILIPLCTYLSFGIAGVIAIESKQWMAFVIAHIITIITGIISFISFPVYPKSVMFIPIGLAIVGMANKKTFGFYLLSMMLLAIAANVVLLNWEFAFGRTLPIIELFEFAEPAIN